MNAFPIWEDSLTHVATYLDIHAHMCKYQYMDVPGVYLSLLQRLLETNALGIRSLSVVSLYLACVISTPL